MASAPASAGSAASRDTRAGFSSAISSTSPARISIPQITRMLPAVQVLC